jgi:hypothetical protein
LITLINQCPFHSNVLTDRRARALSCEPRAASAAAALGLAKQSFVILRRSRA